MQRFNSSELASGSVHGIACALSYVRGGRMNLIPVFGSSQRQNWLSPHGEEMFLSEKKEPIVRNPTFFATILRRTIEVVSIRDVVPFEWCVVSLVGWECRRGSWESMQEDHSQEMCRSGCK